MVKHLIGSITYLHFIMNTLIFIFGSGVFICEKVFVLWLRHVVNTKLILPTSPKENWQSNSTNRSQWNLLSYKCLYLFRASLNHIRELVLKHGSECWWTLPLSELLPDNIIQEVPNMLLLQENNANIMFYTAAFRISHIP